MRSLLPPGKVERVDAARALVLAPHYDDEVLGCGGLVAQLAAAGAAVEVLFLSDGAATAASGESAEEHTQRRRREAAAAAAVLGIGRARDLGLPDGRLDQHLRELAEGIRSQLLAAKPDLLLVPSPLEATADHRAAFAALHRLLSPLRGEADRELLAIATPLTVLAYEVNRPLAPDLLIDITAHQGAIERAMACYGSQTALHNYLGARLGLSRYRTLSLPPEVQAAEAYARLALADFQTRSAAQLIQHLGGSPERLEVAEGPLVSVIVRTKDRPALLREALASLALSHYRRVEVVLVNDGGAPPPVDEGFPFPLRRVDLPQNRGRAPAAQAGVEGASGDYLAFLDDDDTLCPEHLATLVGLVRAPGVRVAYTDAAVGVYELGAAGWRCAERRLPYSRDFDPDLLLLDNYIPFNTLLIERALFAEVGPFDARFAFFEDWDYLIRLAARTPFHHLRQVTCEYRHFRGAGHHILGDAPRSRADFLRVKAEILAKHAARLLPDLVARSVDRLRAEAVELAEERNLARREAADGARELLRESRERHELEERFHRLHGEVVAQREEKDGLLAELEKAGREQARLYGEEQRLAADAGRLERDLRSQTDLVARLYAEIERLMQRITAMEGTRAWRLHQWWQRTRRRG